MYIITDLDDTLLLDNKQVGSYTLEVLKKCKQLGHLIVFNTARSYKNTLKYLEEIKPDYAILNGGNLIFANNEIIYKNLIPAKTINAVISELKKSDVELFSIEGESGLYANDLAYTKTNSLASFYDFNKEYFEDGYKILFSTTDDKLAIRLGEKYNLTVTNYVGGTWYRLSTTTKHLGNVALYKLRNDENPISICFGDDIGDLEMLNNATYGVAMSNSKKIVLENCQLVTSHTSNDNGVAHYLEDLIKKGIL